MYVALSSNLCLFYGRQWQVVVSRGLVVVAICDRPMLSLDAKEFQSASNMHATLTVKTTRLDTTTYGWIKA